MDNKSLVLCTVAIMATVSCSTSRRYAVTGVERSRILVDSTYDRNPDARAAAFIAPYKKRVDSIMSPVVGRTAHAMSAHRPESDLSNLLADILLWGAGKFGEHPDFAVYNMGGIRSGFSAGDVTIGDVLDVAPFENKICFLTLSGDKVLDLFRQMASVGGEGLSRGARLVITGDGKLVSAAVGGKPVDPSRRYRIATIDYLAQGNDRLEAFKARTAYVSPDSEENNARHIIEEYFRAASRAGKAVDSREEGRIIVAGE